MKRTIKLDFLSEDDYADVLVAIRAAHGESTKDPADRGAAIAAICRCYPPPVAMYPVSAPGNPPVINCPPLHGPSTYLDPKGA